MALVLLLAAHAAHACDVQAHEAASGLRQTNFIDDRAASCDSAAQAHRYVQRWAHWSTLFGLIENHDKREILAGGAHTAALRRLGYAARCLKDVARVLSVDIAASLNNPCRPSANKRLAGGVAIANRLMRMPASLNVRRRLWSSRVLSKVTWGLGLRLPRLKELRELNAQYRKVIRKPSMASPWRGAGLDGQTGMAQAEHRIRESWRCLQWDCFIHQGRRELQDGGHVPYCESTVISVHVQPIALLSGTGEGS